MTSKQLLYMDFIRSGYALDEIAAMTHRTPSSIMQTLRKAINKPCREPGNCRVCPLQITCEANYDRVERIQRNATQMLSQSKPPQKGRYSY